MTRRRVVVLTSLLLVAALVGAAAYFGPMYQNRVKAQRAISAYNVALSAALYDVNPALIGDYAGERELSRVREYFTELAGRGVFMDAEMLSLRMEDVRSQPPTITAHTVERWRYVERDKRTGKKIGQEIVENEKLTYTLVLRNGVLIVHLSRLDEESLEGQP